jgi:hypothetical protein
MKKEVVGSGKNFFILACFILARNGKSIGG